MTRSHSIRRWRVLAGAAALAGMSGFAMAHDAARHLTGHEAESPFLEGNAEAMTRMMAGMDVPPSGDVDKDFVEMMVPHHQGAIDMAKLLLRYGENEKLKYIAQEIIVTQQQEIAAMRKALGEALPPSEPAPTDLTPRSESAAPVQDAR